MKKLLFIIFLTFLLSLAFLPALTLAQNFLCPEGMSITDCQKSKLGEISGQSYQAQAGPITSATISEKIGLIISYVLAFLGVLFLVLTVYSGFQWMLAGGNEEAIKKARSRLINAIMGLIIVLAAYAITYFVVEKLADTSGYSQGIEQTAEQCPIENDCCLGLCAPAACRKIAGGDPTDPCAGCACTGN